MNLDFEQFGNACAEAWRCARSKQTAARRTRRQERHESLPFCAGRVTLLVVHQHDYRRWRRSRAPVRQEEPCSTT